MMMTWRCQEIAYPPQVSNQMLKGYFKVARYRKSFRTEMGTQTATPFTFALKSHIYCNNKHIYSAYNSTTSQIHMEFEQGGKIDVQSSIKASLLRLLDSSSLSFGLLCNTSPDKREIRNLDFTGNYFANTGKEIQLVGEGCSWKNSRSKCADKDMEDGKFWMTEWSEKNLWQTLHWISLQCVCIYQQHICYLPRLLDALPHTNRWKTIRPNYSNSYWRQRYEQRKQCKYIYECTAGDCFCVFFLLFVGDQVHFDYATRK